MQDSEFVFTLFASVKSVVCEVSRLNKLAKFKRKLKFSFFLTMPNEQQIYREFETTVQKPTSYAQALPI